MKKAYILAFLFLLSIFIFLRVFHLQDSLLFFNDMGRDFVELIDWAQTGKPPLLGPQTSALSFNQSATYYYLMFPVFLLSGQSAYASFITNLLVYVGIFCYLAWRYGKSRKKLEILLIVWLCAIQTELIRQNRFIWNPSFLSAFLLLSLFCYLDLLKKFSWQNVILMTFFSALAVSFSYSAAPLVLAMALVGTIIWKKASWKLWLGWIVSASLINFPTLVFEIRHQFTLTQLFLHGQTNPQYRIGFWQKIFDLSGLILQVRVCPVIFLLGLLLIVGIGYGLWKTRKQFKDKYMELGVLVVLLIMTLCLILALPIQIEPHYIFGVMVILFMTIVHLPKPINLWLVGCLSIIYLQPQLITKPWVRATRTITELDSCYEKFCKVHPEKMYVSMESSIIAYHNAPEHHFFMKKHGCKIEHIELNQDRTNLMAAVADNAIYRHNSTDYNELTLFGPSEEIEVFSCQDNLKIHVLRKKIP